MFKPARWWNDKNKIKIGFKLQFHASQLTAQTGGDGLVVSIVPADAGKATAKTDKEIVRDGRCFWENPMYETVKFIQDPKSEKIHERIYHFVVGTGSSKAGVVGEASIDFSNYAEATKASVCLPLRNSTTDALLHVSIQRIQESMDQREVKENESSNLYLKDHSVRPQFDNHDLDGAISRNSVEDMAFHSTVSHVADLNADHRQSSGSDVTMSSSESSSEPEMPWQLQEKNDHVHHEPAGCLPSARHQETKCDAPAPMFDEHRRSWEWLGNSAPEASTDDSSGTPTENFPGQQNEEAPDIMIKKLKSKVSALSRQVEISELELQTLRKQIVKETKRGHDLWKEVVCLKEERDALKGECEQFKALQRWKDESKTKASLLFDSANSQAIVEELRQELNHTKELNANLRIQLQKTQESNSELILAVQDLEEMMERKQMEVPSSSSGLLTKEMDKNLHGGTAYISDDDEQKALEDLVKEHGVAQEANLLERQISDLHNEIEIYKREKDELEMQMEQLALDYEIVKQENHNLSFRLEQGQIQEKLKMQYECTNELESHIEHLENELNRRSREHADSLVAISQLETRAKSLEEELEKQSQAFEADLEDLSRSKMEQEQRAVRAEETLKKLRSKNADTVERLQVEFRKLSLQMASTFEANEKLATKAMTEANELRSEKYHLEEMLENVSEENQSAKGQYDARLWELTNQVTLMTNQIVQMQLEIEERTMQLDDQKKHMEESQKLLSDEILVLREEIEMHIAKNGILLEEMEKKETLVHQLQQMKRSMKEMELVMEQGNDEQIELKNRVMSLKNEAEKTHEELKNMGSLVKEKESIVVNLQSELECLQTQRKELEHSLSENKLEKEKLRKQVHQLTSDLKKRDETLKSTKKKMKDGNGRGNLDVGKVPPRPSKPLPHGFKEVETLKERIKLLEGQIKLKETALKRSADSFLEKEKDLNNKIAALEGTLEVLSKSSKMQKASNADAHSALSMNSNNSSSNDMIDIDALRNELALHKENNASMEGELKEMQKRYSEISLMFAEVEGERQQLVMELRNLKNSNKSL